MPLNGVPALEKLFRGMPAGRNIQLVGSDGAKMTEVALNILRHAEKPVFFNMNGMLHKKMAKNLMDNDMMIHDRSNGDEAMKLLRYIVMEGLSDCIVIDDIPSILSEDERLNDGNELHSLELISKTMLRIKTGCIRKGITVIWINQIRSDDQFGMRIWGGGMINSKMQMTLWCQPRRLISRNNGLYGTEIGIKVIKTRAEFARRSTQIGILNDGSIDYAYWVFKEAQRYRLITYQPVGPNDRHKFLYDGKSYRDRWELIAQLDKGQPLNEKVMKQINEKEKKGSLY